MDRFSEQLTKTRGFDLRDDDSPVSTCEGCDRKTTDELVFIPGWDFMGCSACVASCAAQDAMEVQV